MGSEHMNTKSYDTRTHARLLIDAYIESLIGLFALRLDPVKAAVRVLAPKMTVLSSYEGEHVNLNAALVVDTLTNSSEELKTAVATLTAAFVAAMWDLLKSHAHYDKIATEPDVQFFRHLRNACGHDGKWNFTDLKNCAEWRDKRLTMADVGNSVFDGYLKTGDVVLLFIDIDRKHFQQT